MAINDKYKLKKDMPTIKAGEIFIVKTDEVNDYLIWLNGEESIPIDKIIDFDDWFELLIPQYQNDKLWVEITKKSLPSPHDCNTISLVQLRMILEKYKILGDEKDGM